MKSKAYSIARPDRCGSKINEDLFVFAFCFQKGYEYLGPIGTNWLEEHLKLSGFLNLPLPLRDQQRITGAIKIEEKDYSRDIFPDVNALITADFLNFIRKKAEPNLLPEKKSENPQIAMHIRRGDVSFTTHKNRYIPNQYFLDYCKRILSVYPTAEITIFSESESSEDFSAFKELGCFLSLDTDLVKTWAQIINSDVFFMSKSSFSYVPAMYNKNLVVYFPAWYQKLKNWISSEDEDSWENILEFLNKKYGK
jgi:hypothetical protein